MHRLGGRDRAVDRQRPEHAADARHQRPAHAVSSGQARVGRPPSANPNRVAVAARCGCRF